MDEGVRGIWDWPWTWYMGPSKMSLHNWKYLCVKKRKSHIWSFAEEECSYVKPIMFPISIPRGVFVISGKWSFCKRPSKIWFLACWKALLILSNFRSLPNDVEWSGGMRQPGTVEDGHSEDWVFTDLWSGGIYWLWLSPNSNQEALGISKKTPFR